MPNSSNKEKAQQMKKRPIPGGRTEKSIETAGKTVDKPVSSISADEGKDEKHAPIVGIGASAGGLEAFTELLENLPTDSGMEFVLVQHLASGQESMLTDILSRSSRMPVHTVVNEMPVEPNNVYVIPPGVSMTIENRVLKLQPSVSKLGRPVDEFLISLAKDEKNLAIGVILSGTGSDGTEGVKAIHAEGGITFAQSEETAKYPGMPHSAISCDCIHFVLSPAEIAKELVRIGRHPHLNRSQLITVKPEAKEEDSFRSILTMLRLNFGVDFSAYKETTINRRISRRMVIQKIEHIEDYLKYIRNNKNELTALFDDMLIGVTSFFREPETFDLLEKKVFPVIIKDRPANMPLRVWVPGCSTGEEVYSIAIVLREYLEKTGSNVAVQVFGTDVSEKNVEKARTGLFPESVAADITEQRLNKFFNRAEGGYQVNKLIRDMCIFAKQDLTRDPPFSNLDFVSCRNVLIYFKPATQKKIIPIFHYALRPKGYLVLGNSESIGQYDDLFSQLDKDPVYSKKTTPPRITFEFEPLQEHLTRGTTERKPPVEKPLAILQRTIEQMLMSKYAPASVLINDDMEILAFRGNTAPFIEPASGQASLNLMRMAKEELRIELQTAVYRAKKEKASVRREGLQFKSNGNVKSINMEIMPVGIPESTETFFLVLFEPVLTPQAVQPGKKTISVKETVDKEAIKNRQMDDLQRELSSTKETLQTIIEEQESTNEELRSALEEVQSSNEELQSTNEELETAKEELQSTNEELNTLNEELSKRNRDLNRALNDLNNLFTNINMSIIILDASLKIRLFTPMAEKAFNLIETDIGRPFNDLRLALRVLDLNKMILDVINNLVSKEMEVQDERGHWFLMRIRPYLTAEKKIDGAVLSFLDIDAIVRSKREIEKSHDYSQTVMSTMSEPLIVLDADMRVVSANRAFCQAYSVAEAEIDRKDVFEVSKIGWDVLPMLRERLAQVLNDGSVINDWSVEHEFPGVGLRALILNARPVRSKAEGPKLVVVTLDDITDLKRSQEQLEKYSKHLEELVQEKTNQLKESERFVAIGQTAGMVGHDIRNPLQVIEGALYLAKEELKLLPEESKKKTGLPEILQTMTEQANYINKIVSDLQDFSRIQTPIPQNTNMHELITSLISRTNIPQNIELSISVEDSLRNVSTDPVFTQRIIQNLVHNAIQAMPHGGKLTITAKQEQGSIILAVEDTGIGITEENKVKIFTPLFTTKAKGQGFGLAVARRLVESMNGQITFKSEAGKGTIFTAEIPMSNNTHNDKIEGDST